MQYIYLLFALFQAHFGQVTSVTRMCLNLLCDNNDDKLGTVLKTLLDAFDSDKYVTFVALLYFNN